MARLDGRLPADPRARSRTWSRGREPDVSFVFCVTESRASALISIAPAMRPSESLFFDIRGLRYHVRRWPAGADAAGIAPRWSCCTAGWMCRRRSSSSSMRLMETGRSLRRIGVATGSADGERRTAIGFRTTSPTSTPCSRRSSRTSRSTSSATAWAATSAACMPVRGRNASRLVNLEGFGMPRNDPTRRRRATRVARRIAQAAALRPYELRRARRPAAEEQSAPSRAIAPLPRAHWGRAAAGRRRRAAQRPGAQDRQPDAVPNRRNARLLAARSLRRCCGSTRSERRPEARRHRPREDYAKAARFKKTLRYETVPEAGHMLHHDQPEEVARLIEDSSPQELADGRRIDGRRPALPFVGFRRPLAPDASGARAPRSRASQCSR